MELVQNMTPLAMDTSKSCASLNVHLNSQSFLEENFDVLDLASGACHKNFSTLAGAKIILLGEIHHSHMLHRIQIEFLNLFHTKNSCLLIEGLAPGKEVNRDTVKSYNQYPKDLKILGSDIRDTCGESSFEEIRRLCIQLQEFQEHHSIKIANYLNELFHSNQLTFINDNELFVSSDHAQKIRKMFSKHNMERETVVQKVSSLRGGENLQLQFKKSNAGLLQEIQKTCRQFERVFGIWGMGHFFGDRDFKAGLDKLGTSYIVLIPSKGLLEKACTQVDPVPCPTFTVCCPAKESGLLDCVGYRLNTFQLLDQRIQKALSFEPEPISISAKDLIDFLGADADSVTFEPNRNIYLKGIDSSSFSELADMTGKIDEKFSSVLCKALNNWLLFSKVCLETLYCRDGVFEACAQFHNTSLCIRMKASASIVLQINKNAIVTDPAYLFSEMKHRGITEYTCTHAQSLVLDAQSVQKAEELYNHHEKLMPWLREYIPTDMQLESVGELQFKIKEHFIILIPVSIFTLTLRDC